METKEKDIRIVEIIVRCYTLRRYTWDYPPPTMHIIFARIIHRLRWPPSQHKGHEGDYGIIFLKLYFAEKEK